MNLCSDCDIAYEEKRCPLCEAKEEISNLQKRIEELGKEISELELA